jgi:hypothetical protein
MGDEATPTGTVAEVLKAATQALQLTTEQSEKSGATRGGPLLVVGRLYVSLTVILAAVTSASAYFDTKAAPSLSVRELRGALLY